MALLLLAAGVLVLLDYVRRCRSGNDPLGPRPTGALPDTAFAAFAGTLAWLFIRTLVLPLAQSTEFVRTGGFAATVFVFSGANFLLALALLRPATSSGRRPVLTARALVVAGVLSALVVFASQMLLGFGIQELYELLGRSVPRQEIVDRAGGAHGSDLLVLGVSAIVLAPFAEEVFFRGTLLPAMSHAAGASRANVLQAFIFGAIHVLDAPENWPLAVPLAVVGWCAGWLYLRTASLAAPILLHAVFNAINFVALRYVT